ncbi:hypothetical protein HPB48_021018 [Haemaphysalis longicornis]|uniref:Uncharacterized protein n=1 Tax=Haemaphysalis longicornis TaxID=44386 RepID=A0A9J6H4I8_HAELO|nr:hypothetical protein HPB48_021018 [Haemaphysalis longicornis]
MRRPLPAFPPAREPGGPRTFTGSGSSSPVPSDPASSPSPMLGSLRQAELVTLSDAAALLPLCPALEELTLTLAHMNAVGARELADLCVTRCPRLERLTLQLVSSGCSHRTAVNFLQRVARIPVVSGSAREVTPAAALTSRCLIRRFPMN